MHKFFRINQLEVPATKFLKPLSVLVHKCGPAEQLWSCVKTKFISVVLYLSGLLDK